MAGTTESIFNERAAEKLRSPDDLDKYVRVTNPSAWAIVGACAVLLLGLLAWGVFGAVTTSVSATGACVDGAAMCFLPAEDAAKVHVGDAASVGGEQMKVTGVSAVPLSRDEAHGELGSDYLADTLFGEGWAYQVTFDGSTADLASGVPLAVSITVERIAPISLVLGG